MKIRCDIHLNGGHRRLVLVRAEHETVEHMALKLSGFLLFWEYDPSVELSLDHPALLGQKFRPDLVALDVAGAISLWVECGKVTIHKLDKLTRRYANARIVVVKGSEEEGRRLRESLKEELDRQGRIEIWSWRMSDLKTWMGALEEKTYIVGEAQGRSLNLVLNETPIVADLRIF